jgi:hypothetical protein
MGGKEARTTKQTKISGAGLTGTLRLTLPPDGLAHVLEHAEVDEPSGTWTGLAGPDHRLPIGSDVDVAVLTRLCAGSEIADLVWEAPAELMAGHNHAFYRAMRAFEAADTASAEPHWGDLEAIWSHAWAANYAALEFMQEAGLDHFPPDPPQRWVIASFEHHTSPHGIQLPHVHNIVIAALTRTHSA